MMMAKYPRPIQNSIALAGISLASLMFGLEISSVPVILPTLEKLLHADLKDLQWMMNAYTIACTTVLMAAGTMADRYGRKRIFIYTLALFGITSLICGLAQSASLLIVSRFLQGMAGGAMLICQIANLSHQFREGRARSRAFAVWGVIFGIGLGLGPVIGGMIVVVSNWHWVFLVHVPLTIITLALVSSSVEESRDTQAKKLDLAGIVTLSLSVFGLTCYITKGPDLGFTSPAAIGIIAAAAISFLIFIFVERTHQQPMFDFSVFRIRNFSGAIVGSVGMNFSFWPFMIYLPLYFQSGLGYDIATAGLSLLAYTLPTLVIPPLAERLSSRYQPRRIIPTGLLTIGAGFFLMKAGSGMAHASWLTMLPGSLVAGIGLGLTNTPVTNTTTGSVPGTRSGMASGIDMSARLITLAINIALMGFILQQGILAYLRNIVPLSGKTLSIPALAGKIAAGNFASLPLDFPGLSSLDPTGELVHAAFKHGIGLVMLYGGAGVSVLALLSIAIFGPRKVAIEASS